MRNPFGQTCQPLSNIYPANATVTSAVQLLLCICSATLNLLIISLQISQNKNSFKSKNICLKGRAFLFILIGKIQTTEHFSSYWHEHITT